MLQTFIPQVQHQNIKTRTSNMNHPKAQIQKKRQATGLSPSSYSGSLAPSCSEARQCLWNLYIGGQKDYISLLNRTIGMVKMKCFEHDYQTLVTVKLLDNVMSQQNTKKKEKNVFAFKSYEHFNFRLFSKRFRDYLKKMFRSIQRGKRSVVHNDTSQLIRLPPLVSAG